jgi:hypothetical protein
MEISGSTRCRRIKNSEVKCMSTILTGSNRIGILKTSLDTVLTRMAMVNVLSKAVETTNKLDAATQSFDGAACRAEDTCARLSREILIQEK